MTTQSRRNNLQLGYQKINITEDIVFELKKVYLHSSNSLVVLRENGVRIFNILVAGKGETVSVRLLLYALTNVFDFLPSMVDDVLTYGVLRDMKIRISDNMHVSDFSRFLELVGDARAKRKQEVRVQAAWSKLFVITLVVSTIGLVAACGLYFSSDNPPVNMLFLMLAFGILFLIGCLFLLVLPLCRQVITQRAADKYQLEQVEAMPAHLTKKTIQSDHNFLALTEGP